MKFHRMIQNFSTKKLMMRKKAENLEQEQQKKNRVGRQLSGYDFCMR